jgi:hypothetical protein
MDRGSPGRTVQFADIFRLAAAPAALDVSLPTFAIPPRIGPHIPNRQRCIRFSRENPLPRSSSIPE